MRRHGEAARLTEQVDQLEGALERRAVIERAKGILMERHGVDERAAFELLRTHARANNRTVVDCAHAVLDGTRSCRRLVVPARGGLHGLPCSTLKRAFAMFQRARHDRLGRVADVLPRRCRCSRACW